MCDYTTIITDMCAGLFYIILTCIYLPVMLWAIYVISVNLMCQFLWSNVLSSSDHKRNWCNNLNDSVELNVWNASVCLGTITVHSPVMTGSNLLVMSRMLVWLAAHWDFSCMWNLCTCALLHLLNFTEHLDFILINLFIYYCRLFQFFLSTF